MKLGLNLYLDYNHEKQTQIANKIKSEQTTQANLFIENNQHTISDAFMYFGTLGLFI